MGLQIARFYAQYMQFSRPKGQYISKMIYAMHSESPVTYSESEYSIRTVRTKLKSKLRFGCGYLWFNFYTVDFFMKTVPIDNKSENTEN